MEEYQWADLGGLKTLMPKLNLTSGLVKSSMQTDHVRDVHVGIRILSVFRMYFSMECQAGGVRDSDRARQWGRWSGIVTFL